MNEESEPSPDADTPAPREAHLSRLELLTDVAIFQAKLVADGLRDLFLSPLSIIAAVVGVLAGGNQPDRYFRKVIRFGRRTEVWIDLFDERPGPGTVQEFVSPVRSKVIQEAQTNPWLSKAGTKFNKHLDGLNSALAGGEPYVRPVQLPADRQANAGANPVSDGDPPRSL